MAGFHNSFGRARALTTMTGVLLAFVIACGPTESPTPSVGPSQSEPTLAPAPSPTGTATAAPTQTPEPTRAAEATPTPKPTVAANDELRRARFDRTQWKTDFSKRSVPLIDIFSGGPPKDGIPAVDEPRYVPIQDANKWLSDNEPVIGLELNGEARAYPIQILIWHEIVNDVLGGKPVAVTYCPLCNTALVFDATLNGQRHTFGTTGNLRFSDLVMYDRQTESWWQQITGEAIMGELTGQKLTFIPAPMVSWADFKAAFPGAQVLSKETGHSRAYGVNPYTGYDTSRSPFLFDGPSDDRLAAIERVATVELGGETWAFPFKGLEKEPVVHHRVGSKEIVVFYKKGTASALDQDTIAEGRDVGSTGVFIPEIDGQKLTFEFVESAFRDKQTGSAWNLFGEATEGPLKGKRLEPVVHANHFWFAWAVFRPETKVYITKSG